MKKITLFLFLLTFSFCRQAEKKADPSSIKISDINWLAGKWDVNGKSEEHWTIVEESMSGVGLVHQDGETHILETMNLSYTDNVLHYNVKVKGKNNDQPVSFRLDNGSKDSLVFVNPDHDFPSKIVYEKQTHDRVKSWIEGKDGKKIKRQTFILIKQMNQ